ncbi:SET domain [Trinorchestia longiramus]|nr:SET domain [Trinorchestia longiramus]
MISEHLEESDPQQELLSSPPFSSYYTSVCDRVRRDNILDSVMQDFQKCLSDQERIAYVWEFPETRQLALRPSTSSKCHEEAASCEQLYDSLVVNECNADKAFEAIQRAVLKTPTPDKNLLATRFMKRGWALLLQEQFDDAYVDANRALNLASAPGTLWNAHEILGHCHAKAKKYKEAEANFGKALESLKKSSASNTERAAVAGRVSQVLRMVKEENRPKNRSKEVTRKLEENRKKKQTHEPGKEVSENTAVDDVVGSRDHGRVPKVSYGRHPKLLSATSAVRVVVTAGSGRAVVANRDIRVGSVVMVDLPYAYAVNADQLHLRCHRCCRRCATSVPCTGCAVVQYCSESCARKGADLHKLECSVMALVYDASLGKMAPIVFRILSTVSWAKLRKSQEKLRHELLLAEQQELKEESIMEVNDWQTWSWDGQYSPHDYLTTFHLISNTSKRTFGDLLKRSLSAVYITHCLLIAGFYSPSKPTKEELQLTAALVLRHLQNCSCNAYEISEMQLKETIAENESLEIGGAVYPTISLTNHSCFPNVTRYNVGTTCVLRATRFIPKDAEILDNYGYYFHIKPIIERRDALRHQYKFECSCEACREQWPLYPHRQGESVIFKCPVSSCLAPSSLYEGRTTKCSKCGDQESYGRLAAEMSNKLLDYSAALRQMQEGKYEAALQTLLQHQALLDTHAVYPAKHFTDVQEIMRQCMNALGNVYKPKPKDK